MEIYSQKAFLFRLYSEVLSGLLNDAAGPRCLLYILQLKIHPIQSLMS